MENSLQVVIEEQNIAKDNAKALIEAFGAPFTEAGDILATYKSIEVTDESQKDLMLEARTKRLALKKVRTTVENRRKELKEESLRTGKAIDGVAKYIKDNIQPAEDYLELQEKFAEIKESERKIKVKNERIALLTPLDVNPFLYNLDTMQQEEFDKLLSELTKAKELHIAQEKAYADQLERERLEREAEDKKIREENARLKAEAEERDKKLAEEQALRDERERKEREVQEANLAKERALAEEERKKREAIEQEQREKILAEQKAKAEAEEQDRKALLAPDKDKLTNFSKALETIRTTKLPAVSSNQAQQVVNLIDEMLTKMQTVISDKVKEL